MIKLPKIVRDPKETEGLCKCHPVCRSRRRLYNGKEQKSSGELLLERKPPTACKRRWPMKLYPNGPCPLLRRARPHEIPIKYRGSHLPSKPVRLCEAPIDLTVDTTYLQFVELAKKLGAWQLVPKGCAFCPCRGCCVCNRGVYEPHDEAGTTRRAHDMRAFDKRLKTNRPIPMKIMYSNSKFDMAKKI